VQSFLVISKDKERAREYIKSFAGKSKIASIDIYTLEAEKQLGIAEVRKLSEKIFLKPIQGDKKIIVVEAFFGVTVEAQNAFLKVLEEPPQSTYIFILSSENYFLPTINSRAELVALDKGVTLTIEEEKSYSNILENLKTTDVGYKMKLAEDLSKDKNETLLFLEKFIVFLRNEMVKEEAGKFKKIIEVTDKYYGEMKKSNVNLRLSLENLFLNLN
jgi:DNA polymerase III subunit delta'